jgi:hypothetical protein
MASVKRAVVLGELPVSSFDGTILRQSLIEIQLATKAQQA